MDKVIIITKVRFVEVYWNLCKYLQAEWIMHIGQKSFHCHFRNCEPEMTERDEMSSNNLHQQSILWFWYEVNGP